MMPGTFCNEGPSRENVMPPPCSLDAISGPLSTQFWVLVFWIRMPQPCPVRNTLCCAHIHRNTHTHACTHMFTACPHAYTRVHMQCTHKSVCVDMCPDARIHMRTHKHTHVLTRAVDPPHSVWPPISCSLDSPALKQPSASNGSAAAAVESETSVFF